MSTKAPSAPQSRPEQEKVTAQTEVETTVNEEEEEMDEADKRELEEARQQDSQNQSQQEIPEEPEHEPEEIVALRAAVQRIQDKVDWHVLEIEKHHEAVKEHERLIDELKDMLRTKFGGLVGTLSGGNAPVRPQQQRKPGARARTTYGDGNSTGDLVAACLRKARKPINTETIVKYLEEHGNSTNPSVELSRMYTKGLVNRPSRGFYEWVGGE